MELSHGSKRLRIYIGSTDKSGHQPLYEAIVFAARNEGLAGASVLKGIMSYGGSAMVHTSKVIELSGDLPLIIEIIDKAEKINAFLETADKLLNQANCGGMITIEKVDVVFYKPGP